MSPVGGSATPATGGAGAAGRESSAGEPAVSGGAPGDDGGAAAWLPDDVIVDITLNALGHSTQPDMSYDGRFVVFRTTAGNLAADAPDGGVMVVDMSSGELRAMSQRDLVDDNPLIYERPRISGDGKFVLFRSKRRLDPDDVDDVDDLYRVRRNGKGARLASLAPPGEGLHGFSECDLSADGRHVVFQELPVLGDMSARRSFSIDLASAEPAVQLASAITADTYGDSLWRPVISGDARRIAFDARALALTETGELHVIAYDIERDSFELVSRNRAGTPGNRESYGAAFSHDGTVLAFHSSSTNLVEGDENGLFDVFVRDLGTGSVERVSVTSSGVEADGDSLQPALSADGRYVAFLSLASNLDAPGDDNAKVDVFVHDRVTHVTKRVSVSSEGRGSAGSSCFLNSLLGCATPVLSADGSIVLFESDAADLIPGSVAGQRDVYWARWQDLP